MSNAPTKLPETNDQSSEFQRRISDQENTLFETTTGNLRLYCFACHRHEYHYNALKGRAHHYLLIGFTFGLALIFGPYHCRCCGHRRHVRYDILNPAYYIHRWRYSGKAPTSSIRLNSKNGTIGSRNTAARPNVNKVSSNHRPLKSVTNEQDQPDKHQEPPPPPSRRRHRRKKRRLKAVPNVDLLGTEKRQKNEEHVIQPKASTEIDFSIDGIVESFETEASRKLAQARLLEQQSPQPFIAKKAVPRKKRKGKPKRRTARKIRLTGPTIYCFNCQQNNEHFHVMKGTSYFSFMIGITLGLISLWGPFRCSICSKKRLAASNFLNPKYYFRTVINKRTGGYGH